MQIDRILYPINSLGPGKRIVIWTIGCSKQCPYCSNKELWKSNARRDISSEKISDIIKKIISENEVDGITFTGGDPMEQSGELLTLVKEIREYCKDILVYTGYTETQLKTILEDSGMDMVRKYIDVLIDGPYIDELNDESCCLRGSSNQNIIYYNTSLKPGYEEYLKEGRKIQNVYYKDSVISVGIHKKEFFDETENVELAGRT